MIFLNVVRRNRKVPELIIAHSKTKIIMAKDTISKDASLLVANDGGYFSRRNFLNFLGASAGVAVIASACNKGEDEMVDLGVNLGSGDIGILNYAYALEQLEAAFYTKVIASSSNGLSVTETARFNDIKQHEIIHREFFKAALGSNAIQDLEVDFSTINFNDRTSIIATAKAFENLGVSAYNGAGRLIKSGDYLVLAGKIVSVEARHAAYINDLISPGSFANDTDANGLDISRTPPEVLAIAGAYIKTKINASNLPA